MRNNRMGNLLKIIRRQKVMCGCNEGFEKSPGFAGNQTKVLTIFRSEKTTFICGSRKAESLRNPRR
jgi:hypothetical protein